MHFPSLGRLSVRHAAIGLSESVGTRNLDDPQLQAPHSRWLVCSPRKDPRLWVRAHRPGRAKRAQRGASAERTRGREASRPFAPCQLPGACETAGGPRGAGGRGVNAPFQNAVPARRSRQRHQISLPHEEGFSFSPCLADGGLFKLDVEILN